MVTPSSVTAASSAMVIFTLLESVPVRVAPSPIVASRVMVARLTVPVSTVGAGARVMLDL